MAALHLLVGEPTAQGLVSEVLMNPGFAEEELEAFNELIRGCRALYALAEHDVEELWRTKS